jgi:Lipocalin-like domain
MSAATAVASHRIAAREFPAPDQLVSRSAKEQFSGTWKLVSWEIEQANGELLDPPLGPDPLGWIMYQPGGHMSVVLMRSDCPKFASNNLIEATPEEVETAFEGYISYCGSYEVNEQERFVIHRLQLSWFPNLVGTEQKRFFEFAGDRLTLTTPPLTMFGEAQVHRLIWQRLM